MSPRAYRAGMIAGAVSALLLFFGYSFIFAPTPDTSDKPADQVSALWLAFVDDSDKRMSVVIGSFLVVLGALALAWFASALRTRVGGDGPLFSFGLVAAFGAAAGMAGPLATVGGKEFGGDPLPPDGTVVWFTFTIAFPMVLVIFGLAMSAFLATIALLGRGVLPMWLIVFTWIAALAGVFGVTFFPMALVLIWLLVAGIYLAVRSDKEAAPAA